MITIGQEAIECCPIRFDRILAGAPAFVAPYWIDNDPSVQGGVTYEVFTQGNSSMERVSNYISRDQSIDFNGVWMLAAIWVNVSEVFFEEQVGNFMHITFCIPICVPGFIFFCVPHSIHCACVSKYLCQHNRHCIQVFTECGNHGCKI